MMYKMILSTTCNFEFQYQCHPKIHLWRTYMQESLQWYGILTAEYIPDSERGIYESTYGVTLPWGILLLYF